jgi:DNA repair REX1-B
VCAEVTASFSVLSETISAARHVLADPHKRHGRQDVADVIVRLQNGEKEKLNLTAALHLERIRAQAQLRMDDSTNGTVPSDTRILNLLQQGVDSLQQKIATTIEGINEALEELTMLLEEESS